MVNHTFLAVVTFIKINSFVYINSIVIRIMSNLQKDFHQNNLSFSYLQFYKCNGLNKLAGNIQVKNQ